MRKRIYITAVFFLSAIVIFNIFQMPVFAENITKEKKFRIAAENKRLALYVNDENGEIFLTDKKSGSTWRSCPENAENDPLASNAVISELSSPLCITYCEPEKRSDTKLCSKTSASVDVKNINAGIEITYKFKKAGITIPVRLTIGENYLEASVETADIKEIKESRLLTELSIMSSFGAAGEDDDGCFIIPDGCGAVINFNNGKINSKSYSGMVYGRDTAAAPLENMDNTKQIYLPMYGIISGGSGLMTVCTRGDSSARLNASVSGVSKSSYNLCSFDFILRGSDTYYMSGDMVNAITVFESGNIKTDRISLRYYPVVNNDNSAAEPVDIARAYREYLIKEMNVTKSETSPAELYVDFYGAVLKKRSFLGIPITMKTPLTTASQASAIIETLKNAGVSNMVVSFNKWTDDGIKNRIDTKSEVSKSIGADEFYKLAEYSAVNGIAFYPSVQNAAFSSGSGYRAISNASRRISGEYASLYDYNIVSGSKNMDKKSLSILSPAEYPEVFENLSCSLKKNGIDNICLSEITAMLCGDYGSRGISRDEAQQLLTDGLKMLGDCTDSILADEANAYVLPYADRINNVPLCSSEYDIFDEDIPFYQMVLHGLKSYSTEPINGSSDHRELLLLAMASGSNPHYDMIGENVQVISGTELEHLYYTYYDSWTQQAAQDFLFSEKILSKVAGKFITAYKRSGNKIYTEYEGGIEIIVDLEKGSVAADGQEYYVSNGE